MSSIEKPIPRLDLAPKLNRPLSLLNPLDYVRLLYWIFFFPQAIRWYFEKFGKEEVEEQINLTQRLELGQPIPITFQLFLQGLLLTLLTPCLTSLILQAMGFRVNWWGVMLGVVCCAVLTLALGVVRSVALALTLGVGLGVVFGIGLGLLLGVIWGKTSNLMLTLLLNLVWVLVLSGILGVLQGSMLGLMSGLVVNVLPLMVSNLKFNLGLGVVLGTLIAVFLGAVWDVVQGGLVGMGLGVGWILILDVVSNVTIWRPEVWIIGSLLSLGSLQKSSFLFPRITPIPLLFLSSRLTVWLKQDWKLGLENANELLRYSYQFIPVVKAVNQALAETPPESLIVKLSQLTEHLFDWELVKFASASLGEELKFKLIQSLLFWRKEELKAQLRLDTFSHAAAAGFWYLHEKEPEKAAEAFAIVSSLPHGQEMLVLAEILTIFNQYKTIDDIAALELPELPPKPYLRLTSWTIIKGLYRVCENVKLIKNSASRSSRSLALNRVLGEFTKIIDELENLPESEVHLIFNIIKNWQSSLLVLAEEIGEIAITNKVINPYIIGDPVIGQQFIGREDIIKQLEELWILTPQLQSVVLFGHRRMGKTSILLNISTRLDEKVKLAYVNLLTVGNNIQGVGEVFMAIADSLSDILQIPPPDDDSLINLPYRTFERYLKQIETQLGDTGLIIALDEFEQIEELIKDDHIPKDFMGVLRGMVQMSPKIAFALAGLHTLEEMTEDYFNPFFASIIPIRVSFLERATCRYLLANPSEDFPLDYKPDALDYIYDLTAGQPYLVQLIGFLLVRRYNDQVFELGNKRDPMFTIADVDGIINQPEFYQNGRYYFTGVWQQAGEGSPGQQQIIKAIAPYSTGLDFNTLKTVTNLDPNSLQNALDTLSRHDVITETDNHWRIIVELFRRWVINN